MSSKRVGVPAQTSDKLQSMFDDWDRGVDEAMQQGAQPEMPADLTALDQEIAASTTSPVLPEKAQYCGMTFWKDGQEQPLYPEPKRPRVNADDFILTPIHDVVKGRKEMVWTIKHILPRRGVGFLYGASGASKTFVAIELMYQVSTATDETRFLGQKVKRAPVVYICLEGMAGFEVRLDVYEQERGALKTNAYRLDGKRFDLTQKEDMQRLGSKIPNGALVIIDTLSQAAIGCDQNASKDMSLVMGNAQTLSDLIEGFVLIVGHTGKDESKGLAGSQLQKNNADVHLEVTSQSKTEKTLTLTKCKDGRDGLSWKFTIEECALKDLDSDGEKVTSMVCHFEETAEDVPLKKSRAKLSDEAVNLKNVLSEVISKEVERMAKSHLSLPAGKDRVEILDKALRNAYYAKNPIDPDGDEKKQKENRSKAYERARSALLAHGDIRIEDKMVSFTK